MKIYKKFIIVKHSEFSHELMLVRKQPDEQYPDGGLGLVLFRFGRRMYWPENMKNCSRSPEEKDALTRIAQFEDLHFYIMRTMPIKGHRIVDEDDDLFELVNRYIYGNNFL